MYTLRRITKSKEQVNISLGDTYTLMLEDENREMFNKLIEPYRKESEYMKDAYGIIHGENNEVAFLFKGCDHYIMTESGKTFSRI